MAELFRLPGSMSRGEREAVNGLVEEGIDRDEAEFVVKRLIAMEADLDEISVHGPASCADAMEQLGVAYQERFEAYRLKVVTLLAEAWEAGLR